VLVQLKTPPLWDDYLKLDQVLNLYPKSVSQDKTKEIMSVGHGNRRVARKYPGVAAKRRPRKTTA